MLEVTSLDDWIIVFAIALASGAAGGLLAELLLKDGAGQLELPRREPAGFFDLGFIANLIIGAGTALASLAFLPPIEATEAGGAPGYELRSLIGLSIVIGSAGSSILTTFQARIRGAAQQAHNSAAEAIVDDAEKTSAAKASAARHSSTPFQFLNTSVAIAPPSNAEAMAAEARHEATIEAVRAALRSD